MLATAKDKTLFTPGPLTTSRTVKQAMLRDLGSRDEEFMALVADVRARLLQLSGADAAHYTAIPMQGSGTFGMEAVARQFASGKVNHFGCVVVLRVQEKPLASEVNSHQVEAAFDMRQ